MQYGSLRIKQDFFEDDLDSLEDFWIGRIHWDWGDINFRKDIMTWRKEGELSLIGGKSPRLRVLLDRKDSLRLRNRRREHWK